MAKYQKDLKIVFSGGGGGSGCAPTSLRLGITASYTFEEEPLPTASSKGAATTTTSEISFTCPDLKYGGGVGSASVRGHAGGGGANLFHHHHLPMSSIPTCAYSGCSCLGGRAGGGVVECSGKSGVGGSSCSFNGECGGDDSLLEDSHHPQQSSCDKGSSSGGGREDSRSPPCTGCHSDNGNGDGSTNCCNNSCSNQMTPVANKTSSAESAEGRSSPSGSASASKLVKMSCEQQKQQQDSSNNNNVRTKPVLKFSVSAILGADDHKMNRASESTPVFNASKSIVTAFSIFLLNPFHNIGSIYSGHFKSKTSFKQTISGYATELYNAQFLCVQNNKKFSNIKHPCKFFTFALKLKCLSIIHPQKISEETCQAVLQNKICKDLFIHDVNLNQFDVV